MTPTSAMNDQRSSGPPSQQDAEDDRDQRGRAEVGERDHRLAPDRVEEAAERERAEQVAGGEERR